MSVYIRCDWLADGWHGLPGSISLGVVNHLEDEDEHVSSTKGVEIYAGPWASRLFACAR